MSKLADRPFVVGYLLPAILAALAAVGIFGCPAWAGSLCSEKGSFLDLTYQAIAVWAIAVLLLIFNYQVYRFYEGYVWPLSRFSFLRRWHDKRREMRWERIGTFRAQGMSRRAAVERSRLLIDYPARPKPVLPTRFGNRILAFESYPRHVYQAESTVLWFHLQSVISKQVSSAIADAKSQVDFMINISMLAAVLFLGTAYDFIFEFLAGDFSAFSRLGIFAFGALCLSLSTYYFAAEGVTGWGGLVKSCFDCYLPDLAKQMGYDPGNEQQKKFWLEVSQQVVYWRAIPSVWKRPANHAEGHDAAAESSDAAAESRDAAAESREAATARKEQGESTEHDQKSPEIDASTEPV